MEGERGKDAPYLFGVNQMLFRIQYGDKPSKEIRADAGLKSPEANAILSREMAWDLYKGLTGARRKPDDTPPTIEIVPESEDPERQPKAPSDAD